MVLKKVVKILTIIFFVSLFSCGKKAAIIPPFTVSKIFKTDTLTTVNVHIASRMKLNPLLLIAGKLKTDSAKIQNLEIHYLLPGNAEITAGDNSYYASARYLKENEVKPTDTLKDNNGNNLRITIFGLSAEKAKTLLALKLKEIEGKNILGKFIDDYNHTVIIPFTPAVGQKR